MSQHPLFFAIVLAGCSLSGCRTQPLPQPQEDLANVMDLAVADLPCDCTAQPLPEHCRIPCILI